MTVERIKCSICSNMILPATALANAGLCAQCVKIPPEKRRIHAAVNAESDPLARAISLSLSLIDELVAGSPVGNFGAIFAPELELMRFYTVETVDGFFDYDKAAELGSETTDEIEHYLLAASPGYSLCSAIAQKLKAISPSFNSKGRTVFLASWGMGPEEIGWLVRFLK